MSDRISPAQIRGARGLLGWSMMDLARAADVSISTVKRAERHAPELASSAAVAAVRGAFETVGMLFLADNGEGEGLRHKVK